MKKMILVTTAFLMFHSVTYAGTSSYAEHIQATVAEIVSVADHSNDYQVKAQDAMGMMHEISIQVLEEDVFDERWVGDDSSAAWAVDEGNWGSETGAGAKNYVIGTLERYLEESEMTDADKLAYVNAKLKVDRAFTALQYIKGIEFGVMGTGAVQCGISFPSLLILDTKSGKAWQIVMEDSGGC